MTKITVAEWYKALEQASVEACKRGDEGLFTTKELGELWGVCDQTARRTIRQALADGVIMFERKLFAKIDGVNHRIAAYRFVKQPKGKRRSRTIR